MHLAVPRRLIIWSVLAVSAVLLFTGALMTQSRRARQRGSVSLAASPKLGRDVFQDKGCSRCHAVNGVGGGIGPDLAHSSAESSLPQLVTAMWNHAPQMWERMRADRVDYPTLSYEEVAELLAYLYVSRHADENGDAANGKTLFTAKGCVACHAVRGDGGRVGPDLAAVQGIDTPLAWTQAMWNHGTAMEARLREKGLQWPEFAGHELRDLFTYVRQTRQSHRVEGDPAQGWKVFQGKSCPACHSIRDADGRAGPSLGPQRPLPATFAQFGSLMLNHAPKMEREMKQKGITPPQFSGDDMADLFAFLYSLRYSEPAGSPDVGESVFSWRACNRCHGAQAEGTSRAPALRGRGRNYSSVSLATALWAHGNRMYRESRSLGIGWPTLTESDIGDLLAFLNSPVTTSTAHK